MKIAFYITNSNFKDIDCCNIENGNPGIGGTYYAMLQLVYALSSIDNDTYYLLMDEDMKVPSNVNKIIINKETSLCNVIISKEIEYLVLNKIGPNTLPKTFFDSIRETKISVIVWVHCFISNKIMNQLSEEELVKKVVAVSRTFYYTWLDHSIFKKACYIYNMFDMTMPLKIKDFFKRGNNVVYVGAINYVKGVHCITQAWRKVIKTIPDANLYIIGSGKLYSSFIECGRFGIADKYYERRVLKPILDHGEIDKSVHFLGIMGDNKWEIMNDCKVGIVNANSWETFGYTMLEMQLAGMQVTGYKSPGLIDTMHSSAGLLYDNSDDLADVLVYLLNNNNFNNSHSIEFVEKTFSKNKIVTQWVDLFHNRTNQINTLKDLENIDLKYLSLLRINKKLKSLLPFLPSITIYRDLFITIDRYIFNLKDISKIKYKIYRLFNNKVYK